MLHHGYITQTLRERGVQPPDAGRIAAYLRSLDSDEQLALTARMRRIEQGIEATEEIPALVDAIREAPADIALPGRQRGGEAASRRTAAPAPDAIASESDPHTAFLRSNGQHIYGRQGGLKVELDTFGQSHERDGYTIQIEGANKKPGPGFDWERKIQFQVTRRELPIVAAFLLGYAGEAVVFRNHGPARDKSLEIKDQGRHLFVRLSQKHQVVAVPVEPADAFAFGELCLLALQLNRPTIGVEAHLGLLRRVGKMAQAGGKE